MLFPSTLYTLIFCVGLPIFLVLGPLLADLVNGSAPLKDIVIRREDSPS